MRRLLLVALLVIISVALVGTQARLWSDDYCEWTTALQYGNPWLATVHYYNTWTGLFAHFLPRSTLWLIWPGHVVFVTAALSVLSVSVLTSLFRLHRLPAAMHYSLIVLALVTVGSISQQTLYWSTATLHYTIGCLLFIGLYVVMQRGWHPIALMLAAILIAGISETPTVVALVGFAGWGLLTRRREVLPVLIGIGLGLLIVLVAPGNDIRREAILATSDYRFGLATLPFVVSRTIGVLVQIITTPPSLLAGLMIFMTFLVAPRPAQPIKLQWTLIFALMALAAIGLSFVTRDTIPARAVFISQLCLFALIASLALWLNAHRSRFQRTRIMLNVLVAAVGGLIGMLVFAVILSQVSAEGGVLFKWDIPFMVGAIVVLAAAVGLVSRVRGRQRFRRLRLAWSFVLTLALTAAVLGNGLFMPQAITYARSWDARDAALVAADADFTTLPPLAYDWQLDELSAEGDAVASCAVALYSRR